MTILGINRLHYIERVLLYTPIMVGIFRIICLEWRTHCWVYGYWGDTDRYYAR